MTRATCLAVLVPFLFAAASAFGAEVPAGPLTDEQVDARIQQHRTAQVTLTLTDATGKPLADTAVTVRQTAHQFLFGCNAFRIDPRDPSPQQKAYQERFTALLNYATLPFYWGGYEKAEGQPEADRVRAMAEWCVAHDIRIKGHPLCWHQVDPKWLAGKSVDQVQALQLGRISREVGTFKDQGIYTWDVVNEAVVMPGYQGGQNPIAQLCAKLGRAQLVKATFAAARAANPRAFLVLNDFDTSPKYEALIKECLDAGVTIDAVGIQSHQHGGYWGARRAWDVCERFSKFGKPLHFTETTLQSGEMKKQINWQGGRHTDWVSTPEGEARQVREVTEFYRVLFSHPAVEAITWWDLSDDRAWMGAPAGLVRKDMSPKPAYEALMRLVKKDWWTGPLEVRTDARGQVKFRGFLGRYQVSGKTGGEARMSLGAPGAAAVTVQLVLQAGK
jgi:GH35 family endo-1,4-beta-xylanase